MITKNSTIKFRCTESEKEEFKRLAARMNTTPSKLIRAMMTMACRHLSTAVEKEEENPCGYADIR